MLTGLRHRAIGSGHHQDRAIHLRRTGDHVLHIVGMAGTIDVRIVTVLRLILHVRGGDGDAAGLFLRRFVDLVVRRVGGAAGFRQHLGNCRGQRRLAVIDMADRADVAVRLVALEFRLTHRRVLRGSRLGPNCVPTAQCAVRPIVCPIGRWCVRTGSVALVSVQLPFVTLYFSISLVDISGRYFWAGLTSGSG